MRRVVVAALILGWIAGMAAVASAQPATPTTTLSASPCATRSASTPFARIVTPPEVDTKNANIGTPAPCAGNGFRISIEAIDLAFKPREATIPAQQPVRISIHNGGIALHNFSIDPLHISVDLLPGETRIVIIDAAPGDYEFYCDIPGHKQAGMIGTLHVR